VQQGLEQVLGLALGFALLSVQPLEFVDGNLKHESAKGRETHEDLSRPSCSFVSFVIHNSP